MRRGCALFILATCLLTNSAWAGRAVRFDLAAGASGRHGLTDAVPAPQRLTGLVAVRAPADHGLRAMAEAQYLRYGNPYVSFTPTGLEARRMPDADFLSVLLGMEWQPRLGTRWVPFAHASLGMAWVTTREQVVRFEGARGRLRLESATLIAPALSAGLGIRGRLAGRGPGLFADARYLRVEASADALYRVDAVHLAQFFGGASF